MGSAIELMAQGCYGYGRWDAPYWFIGPEQGGSDNSLRAPAFAKCQSDGLCDCKEFHRVIGETRWHRDYPELQRTWRRLMMLLMPSLGYGVSNDELRVYQRDLWGMRDSGETCVIELGGLAAKNLKTPSDRKSFREERIELIKTRIGKCESGPKLVVMYGSGSKEAWNRISDCHFVHGECVKPGRTLFAFMRSPTAIGETDDKWIRLGERIAERL
jgi:hypothetical protein